MRRPRSPDKHSNLSVSQSNTSTFDRKPAKLPPPGYDNPLIGRLVLTPVSELSSQESAKINNLQLQANGGNSLYLLQTHSNLNTPMQEIPSYLFKATETNNAILTNNQTSSEENVSSLSTSQGTASIRNETDKEEENKREVFV